MAKLLIIFHRNDDAVLSALAATACHWGSAVNSVLFWETGVGQVKP